MKKSIIIISILIPCILPLSGYPQRAKKNDTLQHKEKPLPLKIKIKYADALFQAGNYYDALEEYLEILNLKPDNYRAMYQTAECYFKARDYDNAEKWYAKLIDAGAEEAYPLAWYRLATMQKMNGKYDEAKYSFAKYALRAEGDYITRAKREIEACDFAKTAVETPAPFQIMPLDSTINSPFSEYAPAVEGGKLYYSSFNRDSLSNPGGKFLSHIYVSEKNSSYWKKGSILPAPFNSSEFHTGNIAFTPDGKRAYFTQCTDNGEADIRCKILMTAKNGNSWSEPVPLNIQNKEEKFSDTHPAVDAGDTLDIVYFSSNRSGGTGGFDLWYSEVKHDGSASPPVNLGPAVNTIDDEVTPFIIKNKLYFSSNGQGGLGGFDVFVSSGVKNFWSKPQNPGYPLNSSADDRYFSKGESSRTYYLVSNRPGIIGLKSPTCCDDIFRVEDHSITKYSLKGRVFEKTDSLVRLTGARAEVFEIGADENKIPYSEKLLSGDSEFSFELIAEKNYDVKIQKKGYFPQTVRILAKENPDGENITRDITLEKIEKKKAYKLDKIYYEYNKSSLTEGSKESLQKLYELLVENPKLVIEIGSHTDDVGSPKYNMKLSQDRAQSVVDYLIYLGIDQKRLIPKGYGETKPVAPNKNKDGTDNEAGRQQNRRTEFKVIGELSRVGDKIIYD